MESLIDDLLTLAREGKKVTDPEPVALDELIENCWQTVDTAAATLVADVDRTMWADQSRVRQLLENLLRNAVDHGGDDVTITVGTLDEGFYVADDGPGIPEEEREHIFESGYTTSDDGTGFGLVIVQEIANAHDWQYGQPRVRPAEHGLRLPVSSSVLYRCSGCIASEPLSL